MIVNYNCTVITIVNYNHKTFLVQATDVYKNLYLDHHLKGWLVLDLSETLKPAIQIHWLECRLVDTIEQHILDTNARKQLS